MPRCAGGSNRFRKRMYVCAGKMPLPHVRKKRAGADGPLDAYQRPGNSAEAVVPKTMYRTGGQVVAVCREAWQLD